MCRVALNISEKKVVVLVSLVVYFLNKSNFYSLLFKVSRLFDIMCFVTFKQRQVISIRSDQIVFDGS